MFVNNFLELALLGINLFSFLGIGYFIAIRKYHDYEETIADLEHSVTEKHRDLRKAKTSFQSLDSNNKAKISQLEERTKQDQSQIEKHKTEMKNTQTMIQNLTTQNNEKTNNINNLKSEIDELNKTNDSTNTRVSEAENRIQELLKAMQDKDQKNAELKTRMLTMEDNLTYLSGIGPKVSSILKSEGINTFAKLATTNIDRIQEVLEAANPSLLRLTNPTTWSDQAKLAAEEEWEALAKLQEDIKSRKR